MNITWQIVASSAIDPMLAADAEYPLYQRIWVLIRTSYPEGHTGFPLVTDVPGKLGVWILGWDGRELVACAGAKQTPYGNKWTVMAGDGRIRTSVALIRKMVEVLRLGGNYAEVSESIQKATVINTHAMPDVVEVIGPPLQWRYGDGCTFYLRQIDGHLRTKCLIGKPLKQ